MVLKLIGIAAILAWVSGCGAHNPGDGTTGTSATGGTTASTGSFDAGPCGNDGWDNFAGPLFASQCESCHQHTTEFASSAAVVAKQSAIESLVNGGLMPQGTPLAADLQGRLLAWFACGSPEHGGGEVVDAGTPAPVMCASPPDPHNTTSNVPAGDGSSNMLPGENCLACHDFGQPNVGDALVTAGGTVYENQLSNTGVAGVLITVVDANNNTRSTTSHASGNFYFAQALTPPLTVSMQKPGSDPVYMNEKAPSGACNLCHYAPPACGAPGHVGLQIVAP